MNIKKFPVTKIEKELLDINKKSNIKSNAAVQVVINNLKIYNQLLDEYMGGKSTNIYLLYQMSSTIFKQLKEYKILPSDVQNGDGENDYEFNKFIKNVNSKKETR